MPVRDLGTVRETVPKHAAPPPLDDSIKGRLWGCLSLIDERQSEREWHRDLLAVEVATVVGCVLLAAVSLIQRGHTLEALDGKGGVIQLAIPGHPTLNPCESNPYTEILSSHAPVRFSAGAQGGPDQAFVTCGWSGWMPAVRTFTGILMPIFLLRAMLKFECLAAVNTGDMWSMLTVQHGAVRHGKANVVFLAIIGVLMSMCMLSVVFIDLRAIFTARTFCKGGLKGAELLIKGLKFTKGEGAVGIVCSNGVYFATILFDMISTACWILMSRMHIDYYLRDMYEPLPQEGKSPTRVSATQGVINTTHGIGSTTSYPDARGGGGRAPRVESEPAMAGGARPGVMTKEQDPRSWKNMPV